MSAPTGPGRLTMRMLLGADREAERGEVVGALLSERKAASGALHGIRSLSTGALESVDREVGAVVEDLLDLDVADVLVGCWRKHRALTAAARRTLAAPGSEEVVDISSRQVRAGYDPDVDLVVDGRTVKTLRFTLELVLVASGLAAVVSHGDLVGMRGGACDVTATLSFEGEQLLRRQAHLDPALLVRFDPPLALVDPQAVPGAERSTAALP